MNKLKSMLSLMFAIALLLISGCTNPITPAGHEGYVVENPRMWGNGGHQGNLTGPANFGASVWNNQVLNVDFRPQTYGEDFKILAKDDLNVTFRYQTIIKVKAGTIKDVVEKYSGSAFYTRYIKEPLRSNVRNHVQVLNALDIKAQREQIATDINADLEEYLQGTPFELVSGVVGNIDYPDVVTNAVENKLAAQQLLSEKATQKLIATEDANIREEEAKGIAKAQKIINATLTYNYLQHEAIMAQEKMAASPNHTTVYIPVGANGIPIMRSVK